MGHIRLGILPKYPRWQAIISSLEDGTSSVDDIAEKVLYATQDVLASEQSKSCVGYCVWLIAQLTLAARDDSFLTDISNLGIYVSEDTSASEFLSRVTKVSSKQLTKIKPYSVINNIAGLALREALTQTIGKESNTLFGSKLDDVQLSLRKYSTQKQFSRLLHIYFTSFLSRVINLVVDKEVSNHVGPDQRFVDLNQLGAFENALHAFSGQTTRIVDVFSGAWYSKKVWLQGDITEVDANNFVYVALKKLQSDLALNEVGNG